MHIIDVFTQDGGGQVLAPPNAMTIVALERQKLHEKITRFRSLRVQAEAQKVLTETKGGPRSK